MESRELAALLSAIVPELLLAVLLCPSSSPAVPISFSNLNSNPPNSREIFSHLIEHFLSSAQLAASLSLLPASRKRKRSRHPESNSEEYGPLTRIAVLSRNPDSFRLCFRMTASTFEWLSGLLEPLLECRDPAGSPLNLPAEVRLGIGLFRLATGLGYPELARRFGVSDSAARFCAKQLCRVLCTNFRFWVAFPNAGELDSISGGFKALTGLPNCCGVIECTRFEVANADKDKLSEGKVAAQIVVDSSSRILSIAAGFRGDKSNAEVLRSSTLFKDVTRGGLLAGPSVLVNGEGVNQYLVGNLGYPLLPWLMVPYAHPIWGSPEENFNAACRKMRLSALRAASSLKSWGVLRQPVEEEFKRAVAYIGACSILHNVLLMRGDYSALADVGGDDSLDDQSFQYRTTRDTVDSKTTVIRTALATKARESSEGHQNPIACVGNICSPTR